jgi:uncharacterized protein (UPF0147 family)
MTEAIRPAGAAEDSKLAELERLLNDPEVPMDARRVWQLLAELRFATHAPERDKSVDQAT